MKQRDGVVHKNPYGATDYQSVHMKSEYGNIPLCHKRPLKALLTIIKEDVDCKWCMLAIKED